MANFGPKYRYNSEILLLFKLPPFPTDYVRKLIPITFYGESWCGETCRIVFLSATLLASRTRDIVGY